MQFDYAVAVSITGDSTPSGPRAEEPNIMDFLVQTFQFAARQTTHYLPLQAGALSSGVYDEVDNIKVTAAL